MPPMRRRLYLMRHAEVSYFGHDGAPSTREVPLNDEGIEQAKAVADALAGIELDRVVTSGLRARSRPPRSSPPTAEPSRGPSSARSRAAASRRSRPTRSSTSSCTRSAA